MNVLFDTGRPAGQELAQHSVRFGLERVRVLMLPAPAVGSRPPIRVAEFEAGMDAIAEGDEAVPVDPDISYDRDDIYFKDDGGVVGAGQA